MNIEQFHIDEYLKCKDDIVYFTENYLKTFDSDGKLNPIKLYPYQIELMDKDLVTARTSRAIGFTTLACIKILHSIIFETGKTILIYSSNREMGINTLRFVMELYDMCSFDIKPVANLRSKMQVQFDNINYVSVITSTNGTRGQHISELYLQDVDYMQENIEEIIHVTFPTLLSGRILPKIWAWSNIGRNDNLSILRMYLKNNMKFNHYDLPWYIIPNRDSKWINSMKNVMGKESFDREHNNTYRAI
jgi:hypothetical protein